MLSAALRRAKLGRRKLPAQMGGTKPSLYSSLGIWILSLSAVCMVATSELNSPAGGDVAAAVAGGASSASDRAARRLGWMGRSHSVSAASSDELDVDASSLSTSRASASTVAQEARADPRRTAANALSAVGNGTAPANGTAPSNGPVPSGGDSGDSGAPTGGGGGGGGDWAERPIESEEEAIEEELDHFIDGPIAKSAAAVFSITAIVRGLQSRAHAQACCSCSDIDPHK